MCLESTFLHIELSESLWEKKILTLKFVVLLAASDLLYISFYERFFFIFKLFEIILN